MAVEAVHARPLAGMDRVRQHELERMQNEKKWQAMVNTIVSGSVAGMVSTIACHPLDTIRTRMQAAALKSESSVRYTGALDCLRKTVQEEGVRALYKGMAGPFFAQGLYKAVMFGSFKFANDNLLRNTGTSSRLSEKVTNWFLSGVFAGVVNSIFVSPIELVRNRLMVQRRIHVSSRPASLGGEARVLFTGSIDCIRQTIRNERGGILALWKGFSTTILRDGPGVGMWFTCFQLSKLYIPEITWWEPNSSTNLLVSGAMGGVGFWIVALPFDTIKSNIQIVQNKNLSVSSIVRETGLRGLYTGFGVAIIRGIPGAGVVFYVQKRVMEYLEDSA